MGRNIIAGISETISPRGINETGYGKNLREKRDFTKLGKGNFLEEEEGNSLGNLEKLFSPL